MTRAGDGRVIVRSSSLPHGQGHDTTFAQIVADRLAAGERSASVRFESELVFGSGAYAASVEIDEETGALTVHRIAAVDDAGTIINPLLAEGQVLGGTIHGLGAALSEEV